MMIWGNTPERFGVVAKSFHWGVALFIITLLCVGLYMTDLAPSPQKFQIYGLHKAFGITVLLLACLRLGWKLGGVKPRALSSHAKWERALAHLTHGFLYVAMLGMPLSGWAMSSAANYPVSVFGLFTLPNIVPADESTVDAMKAVHGVLAWGLIGAIGLHAAGALKHHIIDKDITLRRMLPGKDI